MAKIKGTTGVGATIAPSSDTAKFPATSEQWHKGGFKSFASIAERDEMNASYKKDGMLCYIIETSEFYILKGEAWEKLEFGSSGVLVDLSQHATTASVDEKLALKADKTELESKLGKAEFESQKANFATKDELANAGGANESTNTSSIAYNLKASENLAELVNAGKTTFKLNPSENYVWDDVLINAKDNITIIGNGAKVSTTDTSKAALILVDAKNALIDNVRFIGQEANVGGDASNQNQAMGYIATHWAIKVNSCYNLKVINSTFKNWRGGGIVMISNGSGSINNEGNDYYNYATLIEGNLFENCLCGTARTSRFEFGRDANNRYYNCCVGAWDEAGNWTTIGSKFTACRNPYVSLDYGNTFRFNVSVNGANAQATANSAHGTVVGCEFNHANNRGTWSTAANHLLARSNGQAGNAFATFNGASTGNDERGIAIKGTIMPTFSGNTLYYCNFKVNGLSRKAIINGCVISDSTISSEQDDMLFLHGTIAVNNVTLNKVKDIVDERLSGLENSIQNDVAKNSSFDELRQNIETKADKAELENKLDKSDLDELDLTELKEQLKAEILAELKS